MTDAVPSGAAPIGGGGGGAIVPNIGRGRYDDVILPQDNNNGYDPIENNRFSVL